MLIKIDLEDIEAWNHLTNPDDRIKRSQKNGIQKRTQA